MNRTTLAEANPLGLYMAFELSLKTWFIAASDRNGMKVCTRKIDARDWGAVEQFIAKAKRTLGLQADAPVFSCFEAGRDGFWIHRALEVRGISNVVLDSASIEVPRGNKHAKTDRIDAKKLLALLLRRSRGEECVKPCVVPTLEQEDARQTNRERKSLQSQLTSATNQIKGLLTTVGLPDVCGRSLTESGLSELRMWNGEPLGAKLLSRLARAIKIRDEIAEQLAALEREIRRELREQKLAAEHDAQDSPAVRMMSLVAVGETTATTLANELMWRKFENRRQVGAYVGLVGVPNQSGESGRDGSISKAGNSRIRALAIEVAWLWLRHQPESDLTKWFNEKFVRGKRHRRVGIVALARRLIIALWRFVKDGVVPQGARLKAA